MVNGPPELAETHPFSPVIGTLVSALPLYALEPHARRIVIEQLEAGRFERRDDSVQLSRRKRLFSCLEVANGAGSDAGAAA